MPHEFEMVPSPYHLGECNLLLEDGNRCGKPAVRRTFGSDTLEIFGDVRRCEEHLDMNTAPQSPGTTTPPSV